MARARTVLLIVASATTVGWGACAFEDPNAPPPEDECISGRPGGNAQEGLYAILDNVPPCTENPSRSDDQDTVVRFTGGGWNADAAACRASQQFFEAVKSSRVANQQRADYDANEDDEITGDERVAYEAAIKADMLAYPALEGPPIDAVGYCIINKDTPSEHVVYSVCGQAAPGASACEVTLPEAADVAIASEWQNCPGGALCAVVPEGDICIDNGGAADAKFYTAHVDNAPERGGHQGVSCEGRDDLDDTQDTIWMATGSAFGRQNSLCFANSPWDKAGRLLHTTSKLDRINAAVVDGGIPQVKEQDPTGASGYCLVYEGKPWEYVLYAMCDQPLSEEQAAEFAAEAAALDPPEDAPQTVQEKSCRFGIAGTSVRVDEEGNGPKWFSCPGSPLCCPEERDGSGNPGCPPEPEPEMEETPDAGAGDAGQ